MRNTLKNRKEKRENEEGKNCNCGRAIPLIVNQFFWCFASFFLLLGNPTGISSKCRYTIRIVCTLTIFLFMRFCSLFSFEEANHTKTQQNNIHTVDRILSVGKEKEYGNKKLHATYAWISGCSGIIVIDASQRKR